MLQDKAKPAWKAPPSTELPHSPPGDALTPTAGAGEQRERISVSQSFLSSWGSVSSPQHFVSERKYDEELGKAARFSCDIEQLKAQIMLCGESEFCILAK